MIIYARKNCLNGLNFFKVKKYGRTKVRCRHIQTVIQQVHHLQSKFLNFRACDVNKGTTGEIWELLGHRLVDMYCVQEI